jgi:hypothetical protein
VTPAQFDDPTSTGALYGRDTVSTTLAIGALVGACIVLAAVGLALILRRR